MMVVDHFFVGAFLAVGFLTLGALEFSTGPSLLTLRIFFWRGWVRVCSYLLSD